MNDTFDYHEFDKRLAVLEERMNTQLAKNESAIDRLRADMERRDTEAARREADLKTEAAKRETRLILALAGMLALAVTVLGLWLS